MSKPLSATTAAAISCMLVQSAAATVIFQSIPDLTVLPFASYSSAVGGYYRVFDTFSLVSATTINDVKFVVDPYFHFPTSVDVSVWTVSSGLPATELFHQTFTPAQFSSIENTPAFTAIVDVAPVGLSLGTGTYDISFYNSSNLAVEGFLNNGGVLYQSGYGFLDGESAGFVLSDIPEATTWTMMMMGFVGIGLVTCRRSRNATSRTV